MGLFGIVKYFSYIFNMSKNTEIWKPVVGYEGVYEVSSFGRVRSLDRYRKYKDSIPNSLALVKGKMLKGKIDKDGYIEYALCTGKHKQMKFYRVHRLVAQAFIPNPNNYPVVNHKDENKQNNMIWVNEDGSIDYNKSNLEWCTIQYNAEYSNAKPILQFDNNWGYIKKWKSFAEIERELGLDHSSIQKCCIGKKKSRGGFKWGYADDYERIPFKVFDIEMYRKRVV